MKHLFKRKFYKDDFITFVSKYFETRFFKPQVCCHRVDPSPEMRNPPALSGLRGALYSIGVNPKSNPWNSIGILAYMRVQIDRLERSNHIGTARNYSCTLNSLASFLNNEDVSLRNVDSALIDNYNIFLIKRGIVRNSISFYMRILRAVYNRAVVENLAEQLHPFAHVYTGVDKTRKRAVSEQVIVNLSQLSLPENSQLNLARDLFLFSYFARGMAFVDMAFLKKSDLGNDSISYTRRKTGQLLTIHIEPQIQKIINKYIDGNSNYVFPIISACSTSGAYEQYKVGINTYNRHLKKLASLLPDQVSLTSYVARHTWATSARDHHVPMSVISAGLGHTSEHTTQIYLSMLGNTEIDAANQLIIASIE